MNVQTYCTMSLGRYQGHGSNNNLERLNPATLQLNMHKVIIVGEQAGDRPSCLHTSEAIPQC